MHTVPGDVAAAGVRKTPPPANAGAVCVRLLDGFELQRDGQVVDLPISVQRVVAFLALHDQSLQRVFVAGSLWIDSTEDRANANLRTALWRLRRPGFCVVDATASHLALARGVDVDVRAVASLARATVRHDSSADAACVDLLTLAGDLLPDWYDDWVLLKRERFRLLRLHALEALCNELASQGRYAEAVETGLAAVAAEPLRESGHRALIRAYLAEGNAIDAIRQYAFFVRLLRRELDLEPSDELRALVAPLPIVDVAVTGGRAP